jgi:prophage regulatory protein
VTGFCFCPQDPFPSKTQRSPNGAPARPLKRKERHQMRFLRIEQVRQKIPYSRATIARKIAEGKFPKPYTMGGRAKAWLESEIEDWITN